MSENKPTRTQIDVLLSDWLGNLRAKSPGNFTHTGKGGIKRRSEESFSDYLIGDVDGLDELELIKQSRIAAEQVVNAVVSEPATVQVGSDGSFHGEQDGRHVICLATDYFDDPRLSKRQKIDIMLGLAAHEAAHGAYTESDQMEKNLFSEPDTTRALKKEIWNILEDERIEYLLGDARPGLAGCVGATKNYFFKKLLDDMRIAGKLPTEPLPKFLSTLCQLVRYPSEVTTQEAEENFDALDKIRRILTPYPLSTEACWEATDKIMDIIRQMAKQEVQKQNQQQDGGGDADSSGNKSGQDTKPKQRGNNPSKQEVQKELEKMLQSQQAQQVMKALRQDEQKSKSNNKNNSQVLDSSFASEYANSDDSEYVPGGSGMPGSFIFKPNGSQESYQESLTRVRACIPAMAKALACRSHETDYVLHGLKAGKLNTNKLVSLRCGNRNIFDKQGKITCSSASVIMLIDESGSMSGSRVMAARDAAILVNEAIAKISNVNFYCYGYTSSKINVYSEGIRSKRWALGSTEATGGTPTGDAMNIAAQRVRRLTSDPCVMLVLTDGAADSSAKVIEQDEKLRSRKIFPIGVGIQTNVITKTFNESIVITDISDFALKLGHLTKGKLDKMLVRTDSLA